MIAPVLFVAAAALGPAPCMLTLEPTTSAGPLAAAAAPAGTPRVDARLGEKVSLELSDADLLDTLEKVAELLDVTLIAGPGVEGSVTLDVRDVPLGDVLDRLRKEHGITIVLERGRMFVRKIGGGPPPETPTAKEPLPRRPTSEKPKFRRVDAVAIRSEKGESTAVSLKRGAVDTRVPGCPEDLRLTLFDADPFDGRVQVIVRAVSDGKRKASRVVSLDSPRSDPTFTGLGTCRLAFVEADRVEEASSSPAPGAARPQYMVGVDLREVTESDEKDLSSPNVQAQEGQSFGVGSRETIAEGTRSILQRGVVFEGAVDSVDLVLATTVLVDLKPSGTDVPMTVRMASAQEWLKVTLGKTTRVMISPTYGLGRSALVADVTVTKMEPRKRPTPPPAP